MQPVPGVNAQSLDSVLKTTWLF